MKIITAALSLTVLCTYNLNSYANDSVFGGEGTSPMPIKQVNVKMLDEQITIRGAKLYQNQAHSEWRYQCNYTFKNTSNRNLQFKMGFPLSVYNDEGDVVTPGGRKIVKGSALVHNFTTTINGKKVEVKRVKIAINPNKKLNYKSAYIWKMKFKPMQTIKVKHSYMTGVTHDAMGFRWAHYVLRTGALWQGGKIDQAKLTLIPGVPTRLCSQIPDANGEFLQPKPDGMEIVGKGAQRQYVWTLNNFTPSQDLSICLQTGQAYIQHNIVYPLLSTTSDRKINVKKLSLTQLQRLRNTIYAQYGRTFGNPNLQKYFSFQWWYAPNSNYSNKLLNKDDKKAIKLITQAEHRLKLSVSNKLHQHST